MGTLGHPRRDDGASLVEFALLLPVLACILLGMTTGGLALATKNSMTNAVREGARLGATLDGSSDWDVWATSVRDRVVEVSGGDVENGDVCVQMLEAPATVRGSWPAGACPAGAAPSTPSGVSAGTCIVKVWAEESANLNAFFFSRDVTLEANAVGLYELGACS